MAGKNISRRRFLRGLGSAALALPALELFHRPLRAQPVIIPKRYLVTFAGMSIGRDSTDTSYIIPNNTGTGYDLPRALLPLGARQVQSEVSVLSDLLIPSVAFQQEPTSPGGRSNPFHGNCYPPLLCGVRTTWAGQFQGRTSDQIVADQIAGGTPVRCMVYRVQKEVPTIYRGRMSYTAAGIENSVEPAVSPETIYQQLTGTAPTLDPATAEFDRDRRVSVLDLVQEQRQDLLARVGRADQLRLEQHFDLIADVETRLAQLTFSDEAPACPTAASVDVSLPTDDPATPNYHEEDKRAEVLCDLIQMAFACDLSRAGSLMFTAAQSSLDMSPIVGGESRSLHDYSHVSNPAGDPGARHRQMADCMGWHVDHFARLVSKLASTQEVDGSRLLDHCALSLVFEGGHGNDTVDGLGPDQVSPNSPHSTENMAALLAGGAGGMVQGRHLRMAGAHPASVLGTAMRAVGVHGGLGEVTQTFDAMFP